MSIYLLNNKGQMKRGETLYSKKKEEGHAKSIQIRIRNTGILVTTGYGVIKIGIVLSKNAVSHPKFDTPRHAPDPIKS